MHCFVLFRRRTFQSFGSRYMQKTCMDAYLAGSHRHGAFLMSPSHHKENWWVLYPFHTHGCIKAETKEPM